MKFLFVINNLGGGGAERIVITLADGLLKRGHEVEIILLENRIKHRIPDGVQVTALTKRPLFVRGWLYRHRWIFFLARRLFRVAQKIEGSQDLTISVLTHSADLVMQTRASNQWHRIDSTLGFSTEVYARRKPAKARRRLARYRRLYAAQPTIAISEKVAEDLRERIGAEGPIAVIPNPFDFKAIRSAASEPSDRPNTPYVIHVARFNLAQKRQDLLLDAWAQTNTGHKLVLLTPPHPQLQAMIDERGLGNRVEVVGFQQNPYPWIAGADLMVLSSDLEGLPTVLIESLICGTPAVSTDCPSGPAEILADFPECLVPCNDAAALAKAIERCLQSPPDVSRTDLSRYHIDSVLDAYERLCSPCSQ